jgi:hypothetical protein
MSGLTPERRSTGHGTLGELLGWTRRAVSGLSFWAAVVLPVAYLPLLATAHLEPAMALVAVHAAALLLGHGYGRAA